MCVVLQFDRNGDIIVAVRQKAQVWALKIERIVSDDGESSCTYKLAIDTSGKFLGFPTALPVCNHHTEMATNENVVGQESASIPTPLNPN